MAKPTSTDQLSRAERKAKKRALEDAIPDLPGDDVAADDEQVEDQEVKVKKRKRDSIVDGEVDEEAKKEGKKAKKEKKSHGAEEEEEGEDKKSKKSKKVKNEKKEKKSKTGEEEEVPEIIDDKADVVMADGDGEGDGEAGPKKSKKERKAERRAAELAAKEAETKSAPSKSKSDKKTNGDSNTGADGESKPEETAEDEDKKSKKNNRNREKKRKGENGDVASAAGGSATDTAKGGDEKKNRFIVFVGNLPFTANKESIKSHFASVQPISVRPMTDRAAPTKCKGTAFVEFAGYDHMKTALKLFHHSNFDDGKSAPRKINVELTAGGGGNTAQRKNKITEKNTKLNEQRVRRMQEEEKAKLVKVAEGGKEGAKGGVDESAIHPSRRRYVPGAAGSA